MKKINKKTIKKISETKLKTARQNILNGINSKQIPEPTIANLAIPTHRTKARLTFEEYKEKIQQGITTPNLNQQYSKHLVAFYSSLAKGRITITKDQFESEYNNGLSINEISSKYKIPRENMTYLREYYGIKRKGATYQRRLKNEVPLSQEAKDVIIGSLLGDGHITPNGYFSEKHSEKQVEYLEWKAEFLKPILNNKSFYVGKYFDKRYGTTNYSFCLRTITHSFLHEMRKKFYKEVNGKTIKIVPEDIEDMMNERVLAVWFMDDGNTDWQLRKEDNTQRQCKISSESFSLAENNKLSEILKSKWNIIANIKFRMPNIKHGAYLRIEVESSGDIINIIKPYVVPCLLYKVDVEAYKTHKNKIFEKEKVAQEFAQKHNMCYPDPLL